MTFQLLVPIADRCREHVIAAFEPGFHLLQGLPPVLQALELSLGCDDSFDELPLGRVLELEVQALDGGAVCRQLLPEFQVEDRGPGEALQIVEDDDVAAVRLDFHEPEHRDHAGALHEVAAAGHVVVEDRFDLVAAGSGVVPARMLLALQPVAVVSLLFVGDPAVDDGPG